MGRRSMRLAKATDEPTAVARKAKPNPVTEKKKAKKHKKNKENRARSGVDDKDNVWVRKREDGTTSLAILTPGEGVVPGTEKDRPVSLGQLLGRVRFGSSSLATFIENGRNSAKPMVALQYGGYSSHGPSHDSTFATLTQEESAMVGPFFDQRKGEHTAALARVAELEDYSSTFVDHLLDLLQGRKVEEVVEDNTKTKDGEEGKKNIEEQIDFELLRSLEKDGIDVSFMSTLQAAYELRQQQEMKELSIEEQLELTAKLIEQLAVAQSARLAAPPPSTLNLIPGPGEKEARLAERVTSNLTTLTGAARPEGVVQLVEVRRALGVASSAPSTPPVVVVSEKLSNGVGDVEEEEMEH